LSGATVSVGSLNNTDVDRVNTSGLDKIHDEHGSQTSNLVTIQQVENTSY
jgi:hypothetical protein